MVVNIVSRIETQSVYLRNKSRDSFGRLESQLPFTGRLVDFKLCSTRRTTRALTMSVSTERSWPDQPLRGVLRLHNDNLASVPVKSTISWGSNSINVLSEDATTTHSCAGVLSQALSLRCKTYEI